MACLSTISLKTEQGFIHLPCGKCENCLSEKRAEWTFRILEELKTCVNANFLTLTYDDKHLPRTRDGTPTLQKTDVQKFLKKLRKLEKNQVRYYLVGEYGEITKRPHYHAIIFNTQKENVEKTWQKGNIHMGTVNQASIHYVTKYIINRFDELIDEETGEILPVEKPKALMSRRPSIGYNYIKRAKRYHRKTGKLTMVYPGGHKQRLPRIYLHKIFKDYEIEQLYEKQITEIDASAIKARAKIIQKSREKGFSTDESFRIASEQISREIAQKQNRIRIIQKQSKSKKL